MGVSSYVEMVEMIPGVLGTFVRYASKGTQSPGRPLVCFFASEGEETYTAQLSIARR